MAARFVDTHCHVNLYADRDEVLARAEAASVLSLVITNRASEYRNLRETYRGGEWTRLGLGFHPEAAGSPYEVAELEIFERYAAEAEWIAETGLDGVLAGKVGPNFGTIPTLEAQERVLERILAMDVAGKPFSVHSRGAVERLVSILTAAGVGSVIFHWLVGGRDEARPVLDAGYFLSVNPAMLTTDEGRDLCAWLPADRLLLETDGPFVPWNGRRAEPADCPEIVRALADLRGDSAEDLEAQISRNVAHFI